MKLLRMRDNPEQKVCPMELRMAYKSHLLQSAVPVPLQAGCFNSRESI
jgi:hypothetical protein